MGLLDDVLGSLMGAQEGQGSGGPGPMRRGAEDQDRGHSGVGQRAGAGQGTTAGPRSRTAAPRGGADAPPMMGGPSASIGGPSVAGAAGNASLMAVLTAMLSQGGQSGGLGGELGDLLGSQAGAGPSGARSSGASGGMGGGFGDLLDQFARAGHGDVARSWVSPGENRALAPRQLEDVLGGANVDAIARRTGMGRDDLLAQLSALLPQAVDRLTPQGRMPDAEEMRRW